MWSVLDPMGHASGVPVDVGKVRVVAVPVASVPLVGKVVLEGGAMSRRWHCFLLGT
jgi:hypothetical protein